MSASGTFSCVCWAVCVAFLWARSGLFVCVAVAACTGRWPFEASLKLVVLLWTARTSVFHRTVQVPHLRILLQWSRQLMLSFRCASPLIAFACALFGDVCGETDVADLEWYMRHCDSPESVADFVHTVAWYTSLQHRGLAHQGYVPSEVRRLSILHCVPDTVHATCVSAVLRMLNGAPSGGSVQVDTFCQHVTMIDACLLDHVVRRGWADSAELLLEDGITYTADRDVPVHPDKPLPSLRRMLTVARACWVRLGGSGQSAPPGVPNTAVLTVTDADGECYTVPLGMLSSVIAECKQCGARCTLLQNILCAGFDDPDEYTALCNALQVGARNDADVRKWVLDQLSVVIPGTCATLAELVETAVCMRQPAFAPSGVVARWCGTLAPPARVCTWPTRRGEAMLWVLADRMADVQACSRSWLPLCAPGGLLKAVHGLRVKKEDAGLYATHWAVVVQALYAHFPEELNDQDEAGNSVRTVATLLNSDSEYPYCVPDFTLPVQHEVL